MSVKTGLKKLDSILKGGMPENSSILLLGPPKSGKTTFGMQFLFEGLSNNEYGIFITTTSFPEELVKKLEKFGKLDKFLEAGLLRFVDCYSTHVGVDKENTLFIVRVNGPTALTEIGIAFTKILEKIPKSRIRIVFDSISTLLLYNPMKTVANFMQMFNGKAKNMDASTIFILEEGAHEERDITTINSLLDVIIHLKMDKNQNYIEAIGLGVDGKAIDYSVVDGKIRC